VCQILGGKQSPLAQGLLAEVKQTSLSESGGAVLNEEKVILLTTMEQE